MGSAVSSPAKGSRRRKTLPSGSMAASSPSSAVSDHGGPNSRTMIESPDGSWLQARPGARAGQPAVNMSEGEDAKRRADARDDRRADALERRADDLEDEVSALEAKRWVSVSQSVREELRRDKDGRLAVRPG